MRLALEHAHRLPHSASFPRRCRGVTVTSGEYGASRSSRWYSSTWRTRSASRQRLARGRQNRHGHQVDRRHGGRGVDSVVMRAASSPIASADPAGAASRLARRRCWRSRQCGIVLLQQLVEDDGLAQIHVHLAELAAQDRDNRLEQAENAFLFLRLPDSSPI